MGLLRSSLRGNYPLTDNGGKIRVIKAQGIMGEYKLTPPLCGVLSLEVLVRNKLI